MPRKIPESTSPADVDAETARRRARQLEVRLRMCTPEGSDLWQTIVDRADVAKELPPTERLAALLDLADDVRPALPEGARMHTLPATVNRWRA